MKIISICGIKRSGKDTLANHIATKYNYKHVKIAEPLKKIIQDLFQFTDDEMETNLKELPTEKWNTSPRQLMDFIGTKVFQYDIQNIIPNIGRKFWIKTFLDKMYNVNEKQIVISDLRFFHELEELKAHHNCCVVKIKRNNTTTNGLESEIENEGLNHDILLINDGTIDELHNSFDMKYEEYLKNI